MQKCFLSNALLCSYRLKASDVTRWCYCMMRYPGDEAFSKFPDEAHVAQKGEVIYLRSPSKIMKQS